MLSRTLSLATVTLLIGYFATPAAWAQATNLEAGKSPSQIFTGTCTACHKSPRGLLKTVPAGSLQSFLRQHYTTSPEMASLLTTFLISNGATDTRYGQTKDGKEAKPEARPSGLSEQLDRFGRRLRPAAATQEAAKPEPAREEAAKPDADALPPQGDGHHGRNAKRLARPGEAPDATQPAAEGQGPVQAATEPGPDGRKLSAKQRLSKRGRPGGEELPKTESAKTEEPSKGEAAKDDKPSSEANKDEGSKPEGVKPSDEGKSESAKSESGKSESAKIEAPKETSGSTPVLRADPVPLVTPAPSASQAPPAVSAAITSGGAAESAPGGPSASPAPPPAEASAPPAVTTASAPPQPPVPPAGPPAPPISQ